MLDRLPERIHLNDRTFAKIEGACYVRGYFGERYMSQWSGVGPSPCEYRMKAIVRDGVVYVPEDHPLWDDGLGPNGWRTLGTFFVRARIEIPADKIEMCRRA